MWLAVDKFEVAKVWKIGGNVPVLRRSKNPRNKKALIAVSCGRNSFGFGKAKQFIMVQIQTLYPTAKFCWRTDFGLGQPGDKRDPSDVFYALEFQSEVPL